ncbi:unnamed protein product [Camellia sinensis]
MLLHIGWVRDVGDDDLLNECLEDQFDARCWNNKHLGRHSFHNAARLCLPSRYVHGTLCNASVLQHHLLYWVGLSIHVNTTSPL